MHYRSHTFLTFPVDCILHQLHQLVPSLFKFNLLRTELLHFGQNHNLLGGSHDCRIKTLDCNTELSPKQIGRDTYGLLAQSFDICELVTFHFFHFSGFLYFFTSNPHHSDQTYQHYWDPSSFTFYSFGAPKEVFKLTLSFLAWYSSDLKQHSNGHTHNMWQPPNLNQDPSFGEINKAVFKIHHFVLDNCQISCRNLKTAN